MTRSLSLLGSALLVALATACGGDDGNNNDSCGDGHVTGTEMCDDGNTADDDGCSSSCKVENCGDGVFDVATEGCDDGNTTAGDGCSATCQKEGTCGNGMVEAGESCDDGNTMSTDGCNGACAMEPGFMCTGMPSTCSPTTGGGSCAAPGIITLAAMGTDMVGTGDGDTTNATNGLPEADCDGDVAGGGKDNIWTFTTTDTRDVLVVLSPSADFDGGIRLMTTSCDTTTEVIDQVGTDGCSDSGFPGEQEFLGYVNLPAGTYYVSVDGYTDADAGAYELTVIASMPTCGDGTMGNVEFCDDGNMTDGDGCTHCTVDDMYNCDTSEPSVCQMEGCGDGLIQSGEDCDDDDTDDGDGCSSTCTVEMGYTCLDDEPSTCVMAGCGNGIIETDEECDDGNMTDGDRCDSSCVLESDVTEAAEPNNTTAQVLSAGSHIIRGTFEDGDVDLYTFTLAATSKVELETYATINGTITDYDGVGTTAVLDCLTSTDDTELAIFPSTADPTMDAMALFIDDDDGAFFCSYLGPNDSDNDNDPADVADPTQLAALPAGTYTIRLQPSSLATTIPTGTRYMLDLKIVPAGSAPVPPAAGDLKINEFLAADGGTTNGGVDSNCDGLLTNSDDEFIELVNVTSKLLDLTGVTYSDALGVKFTFAPQANGSLTLEPGKAVVIWGGGTPMCPGVTNYFTNGTKHTMSLNDSGDTITIATGGATPVTIATTTYASGTIGKSLNVSPDVTGTTYALHATVAGAVGNFSPGTKVDGSAF